MLRAIAGVIVGYIVMFAVVFAGLTAAYLIVGTDGAFQEGSYDVSMLWIGIMVAVGLVAAILGGLTCAAIAEAGSKAPMFLAGMVLVLGLLSAIGVMMDTEALPARTAEVDNFEAMMEAKQPLWSALVNPIIGAVGVVIGAGLIKKKPAATAKSPASD